MRDDLDGVHGTVAGHRVAAAQLDRFDAGRRLGAEPVVVVDGGIGKDQYVAGLTGDRSKVLVGAVQTYIQTEPVARIAVAGDGHFKNVIRGERVSYAVRRFGTVQPQPVAGGRKLTVDHLNRAAVILDGCILRRGRCPVFRIQLRRVEIVAESGFLDACRIADISVRHRQDKADGEQQRQYRRPDKAELRFALFHIFLLLFCFSVF